MRYTKLKIVAAKVSDSVKKAVVYMVNRRTDLENQRNGFVSEYRKDISPRAEFQNNAVLKKYGIEIKGAYVYQHGETIAEIKENYATRKINGTYKLLKPTVNYL